MTGNAFFEILCDGKDIEFCVMKSPTYIKAFFDYSLSEKEDITLIYGVKKSEESNSAVAMLPSLEPGLEITGNPLECPFTDDDYEQTVSTVVKCWLNEEESHLPIPIQEARDILSAFNVRHSDEEKGSVLRPVWVVCSDPHSQTVLLSSHIQDCWCTATRVRYLEDMTRQQICERLAAVQLQHLSITGTPQQELLSEVTCTYNIHGDPVLSKQHVSLEVKWANNVTLNVPLYDAEATIMLKVTVGENESVVNSLWVQLNALSQCIEQLTEPQKSVEDAAVIRDVTDATKEKIVAMLKESSYKLGIRYRDDGETAKKVMDLEQIATAVASGSRSNRDLMDMLWLLLFDFRDTEELANCIYVVLKTVKSEGSNYNIHHAYRNTRLARLISQASDEGLISQASDEGSTCPRVQPGEALEMLVEIGMEKLLRDYWFILLEAELVTADQLQHSCQILTRDGSPAEVASSKLSLLGQLHCWTEVLLLAYRHIDTSPAMLRHLGTEACRSLPPSQMTFQELVHHRESTLHCTITTPHVQTHISRNFSRYRLSLSTRLPLHEVKTVFLCSLEQVFPDNIISCPGESLSSTAYNNSEETYFCYELLANKNKLA